MVKAVGFTLGNLAAGWILGGLLASQLHYPPEIPVRVQPQLAGLIIGFVFSLAGIPIARLITKVRTPCMVLSMPVSIAAAGAALFPLDRGAGALIALTVAHNSPLALAAGAGWALIWSFLVYRPHIPLPPPPPVTPREELPVSDNWSGAER